MLKFVQSLAPLRPLCCAALLACGLGGNLGSGAQAAESFVYMTNWFAQAEHGGFYQALAQGLYRKHGLEVRIQMGGPQINITQMMAAGQADCIMGASDLQMLQIREAGVPVTTVAAVFQKDPLVLIAHEDVKTLEDLKSRTILVAPTAQRGYWAWLKAKHGFSDAQMRPYTFNIQPFLLDKRVAQQGYLTSEPFSLQKAGVKTTMLMLADLGFPSYTTTISCMEQTVAQRRQAVAAFVRASMEGWKSYLADPAPGNALIKQANPAMTDEQLRYSVDKIKETGMVTGGDAARLGIGVMTQARIQASYDFLVSAKLINPAKVKPSDAYHLGLIQGIKVLP